MTHRHVMMLKSGIHEPWGNRGWYYESYSRRSGQYFADSLSKSEKNVVLEVSKLTKIIVCFQDASAMKKKILISSMVMFSWNQKVIKERYLVYIYSETHSSVIMIRTIFQIKNRLVAFGDRQSYGQKCRVAENISSLIGQGFLDTNFEYTHLSVGLGAL